MERGEEELKDDPRNLVGIYFFPVPTMPWENSFYVVNDLFSSFSKVLCNERNCLRIPSVLIRACRI